MAQKATKTGPGAMGLVAMEQGKFSEGERIINDHLAYQILPLGARAAVWLKMRFPRDYLVNWAETW